MAESDIEDLNELYCDGVKPVVCRNNPDYGEKCDAWAADALCTVGGDIAFMLKHCKKSCGCPETGKLYLLRQVCSIFEVIYLDIYRNIVELTFSNHFH